MTVFVAPTTRDVLAISGAEAITWLQGQLSQDIAGLAVGGLTWSFVLAPQGKVDGWGRVERTAEDAVRIDVDAGAGQVWADRLNRFKLRTKADVELATDVAALAVRGSQPEGSLAAGWPGTEGGDLLAPEAGRLDALVADGAVAIDGASLDGARIRAGVPRWGAEIDSNTIPATLGQWVVDASVSFTKGCYTGQELVARIDSRGGNVPRRLAVVLVDADAPPIGATVTVNGESAGTVTSSGTDPATGASVALAFVPRSVELPAAALVEGGSATLSAVEVGQPAG